jgi:hypothetical protein
MISENATSIRRLPWVITSSTSEGEAVDCKLTNLVSVFKNGEFHRQLVSSIVGLLKHKERST